MATTRPWLVILTRGDRFARWSSYATKERAEAEADRLNAGDGMIGGWLARVKRRGVH